MKLQIYFLILGSSFNILYIVLMNCIYKTYVIFYITTKIFQNSFNMPKSEELKKAKSTPLIFEAVDPPSSTPPPLPSNPPPSTSTESEELIATTRNELPVCPYQSTHSESRLLCNIVVQMSADNIYRQIYTNNNMMNEVYSRNKVYDITYHPWEKDDDTGNTTRTVTYTMDLPPTGLGPKVSHVTEIQTILATSEPGKIYIVEVEASNSGIPYADNFCILTHNCISKETVTGDTAKYYSCANIKYKKSTWGVIKNIIEKNAFNGMDGIQEDIGETLQRQASSRTHDYKSNVNMVKRRKRRTGSADLRGQKLGALLADQPKPAKLEKYSTRCWIVVLLLLSLCSVNLFLIYKLRTLELRSQYKEIINLSDSERTVLKSWVDKGRSWQDVTRLLEKQEQIHTKNLQEWMGLLSETAESLNTAETSLKELKNVITHYKNKRIRQLIDHMSDETDSNKQIPETCLKY